MARRRTPATAPEDQGQRTRRLVSRLAEAGWVVPWSLAPAAHDVEPTAPSTPVGTLDGGWATAVDQRGLIDLGGWSLDWWIGAEDRWHLPSRETAVRQHLIGLAPVVETLVRVPGGDAVQRVFAMRGAPHPGGDEYLVVELENRSRAPLAAVAAVRPFGVDQVGRIGSVTVEPVAGGHGRDTAHLVRLDGRPALVLPRRPARSAGSTMAGGDVAATVLAGDAPDALPDVVCDDALAQAAFVFPVPHTAALRLVLPRGCGPADPPVPWPPVIPTAEQVASGWAAQSRPGLRLELPDARLADAVTASRRFLLLEGVPSWSASGGWERAATVLRATGRLGGHDDVRRALLDRPDPAATADPESAAALVSAVAEHWRLTRDAGTAEELLPEVAAHLERTGRDERRGRLRSSPDRRRAARAVTDARELLAGLGQTAAADRVGELLARLDRPGLATAGPGDGGAGPTDRGPGPEPADGRPSSTVDGRGPTPTPSVDLAAAIGDLAAWNTDAVARLARVLDAASPTWTWPAPDGPGHDVTVWAALVDVVRSMLVRETGDGLALLSVVPPAWLGGGIEVHDAPTGRGQLSFAVRWHGDRPALLWELQPHPDQGPVRLTCAGLDPSWSTVAARGDALLAPVAPSGAGEVAR